MSDPGDSHGETGATGSFNRRRFVRALGASGVVALAGCSGGGDGGDGSSDGGSSDGGDGSSDGSSNDGSDGSSDGASGDGASTDTASSTAASGREVTYWTLFGGGDGETMRSMVESVNAETDLAVNRQRVPFGEYYDRLYTSLTGGEAPDVAVMHADRLVEYEDLVVPLTDHISTDAYADGILNRVTVDDQLLGAPLDTHPQGLWYNKDIFAEAGLDPENPPQSPEEFVSACETIASETDYNVGQIHAGGLSMGWFHMSLRSRGTQILDENNSPTFNNEDGVAVAEFYDRMVNEEGWIPQSSDEGWNAWNNGEAAWLVDGTWHLSVARGLDFDFGLAKPYMMPGSDDPVTSGNSHTLVVPRSQSRDEETLQAAVDLIRNLTQDYNFQWGANAGHLPASQAALESEELRNTDTWADSLGTFYEMTTNGNVAYMPRTSNNGEYTTQIWQRLNAVRQDDMEPQEAIEAAAQGVNQVFR
jgi:multiple sugar transport system substrate-binding protein